MPKERPIQKMPQPRKPEDEKFEHLGECEIAKALQELPDEPSFDSSISEKEIDSLLEGFENEREIE